MQPFGCIYFGMDEVFKAIADPTRRRLLDLLFEEDGRTLTALCGGMAMSRQAVAKHLAILEGAQLIAVRWSGREKLHYLNAVPIRAVHDRWIDKYRAPWVNVMTELKTALEGESMSKPHRLFVTYIRTTPELLWQALIQSDFTKRYFFSCAVESTWERGAPISYRMDDGTKAAEGEILDIEAPKRLVMSWRSLWSEELMADPPSRVAWEIEAMGELCKLTLLHDEYGGETATYHETEGWALILAGLKTLMETGQSLPAPEPQ